VVLPNLVSRIRPWLNGLPSEREDFWLTVLGAVVITALFIFLPGCAGIAGPTLSTATHGAVSVQITRTDGSKVTAVGGQFRADADGSVTVTSDEASAAQARVETVKALGALAPAAVHAAAAAVVGAAP
jgi:hypothetical protein